MSTWYLFGDSLVLDRVSGIKVAAHSPDGPADRTNGFELTPPPPTAAAAAEPTTPETVTAAAFALAPVSPDVADEELSGVDYEQLADTAWIEQPIPTTVEDSDDEGDIMATIPGPNARLGEGRPYDELAQGKLNASGYAASAAWSLTAHAAELIHEACLQATRSAITNLARLTADMAARVTTELIDSESMHSAAHSRARHAIFAMIRLTPIPFGGTADEWQEWGDRVVNRAAIVSRVAVDLWADRGEPDYDALAVLGTTGRRQAAV